MNTKLTNLTITALFSASLAACGGSSAGRPAPVVPTPTPTPAPAPTPTPTPTPAPTPTPTPTPAPTPTPTPTPTPAPAGTYPAGVYLTTTSPSSEFGAYTEYFTLLDNGEFYGIMTDNQDGWGASTLEHGTVAASGSNFVSNNAIIYLYLTQQPPETETFSLTYSAPTFSTVITANVLGADYTYNNSGKALTYSATDSTTIYNNPAALSTLVGSYTGRSYAVTTAGGNQSEGTSAFAIAADGSFTATAQDCSYAGKMTQHGSTGVFDASVTVSGSTACSITGMQMQGIVTPLSLGSTTELAFLFVNSANNVGLWFNVTKN